jgi:hypothetical protein
MTEDIIAAAACALYSLPNFHDDRSFPGNAKSFCGESDNRGDGVGQVRLSSFLS